MVAPAEKASLLGTQPDNKQCCEEFVTAVSCFPQSMCNSLALSTSVLMRLLLDLAYSTSKESYGYYCSKTKHNFL